MNVLEENDCYNLSQSGDREYLAKAVAKELVHQSLEQLARLTEGELLYDNDGQAVIYTSVYNPDYDRASMQHVDPFDTPPETDPFKLFQFVGYKKHQL